MRKRSKDIAVGTVLAAGVGYLAGILTAPKSGRETRRDIERAAIRAKSEAERALKRLHTDLTLLIKQADQQTKTAKETAKPGLLKAISSAQDAKERVREILSALHEGESENHDISKAIDDVNDALERLKKYIKSV